MSEDPQPVLPLGPPVPDSEPPLLSPPPERYPFWNYSDLGMFLLLSLPSMLLGVGVIKAAKWWLKLASPNRAAELLAGQFVGYALLFGVLAFMLRVQYNRPFWRSLGWTDDPISVTSIIRMVLSGISMAFAVAILGFLINTPTTANPMTELLKDRASVILMAIFGITVGPLCEELIFRGFLQPLLVRSLGALPGIIATAVPFGLLHYTQYGNSWRHFLLISLAGVSFGAMRHATGSIKASTIMHGAYNSLFFVMLLLQRSLPVP